MNFAQFVQTLFVSALSLGALLAGAGYGWGQFKKGRDDKSKTDYDLLDRRLETLQTLCENQQKELNGHQLEIRSLRQEIGRLQGINEEKEKKIKELTDMLAGRDPQLTEYIKTSTRAFSDILGILGSKRDLKELNK